MIDRLIRRHVDHVRKTLDVEIPDIPIVLASVVPSTKPLPNGHSETQEECNAESKINSDSKTSYGRS